MNLMQPGRLGYIVYGTLGIIVCVLGYVAVHSHLRIQSLEQNLTSTQNTSTEEIALRDQHIASLEASLASTTELLSITEEARATFQKKYEDKADEVDDLALQIKKITGTVGTLEKLAETDPELLMKYSKVYFLNEHYTPEKLTQIASKYTALETDMYLESRVYKKFKAMVDKAEDDDIEINVRSAYRSFDTQRDLKGTYSVTYGSGANTFSADQGYSEHQLGTTVDLTSPEVSDQLSSFDTTKAYDWLQKNAYKYGFILSYPKDNSYYIYEPWHWRYVGVELATYLHKKDENFYDLDQREIDKYLVNLFD